MSDGNCSELLKMSVCLSLCHNVAVHIMLLYDTESDLFSYVFFFDITDSAQHLLSGRNQQPTIYPQTYCE